MKVPSGRTFTSSEIPSTSEAAGRVLRNAGSPMCELLGQPSWPEGVLTAQSDAGPPTSTDPHRSQPAIDLPPTDKALAALWWRQQCHQQRQFPYAVTGLFPQHEPSSTCSKQSAITDGASEGRQARCLQRAWDTPAIPLQEHVGDPEEPLCGRLRCVDGAGAAALGGGSGGGPGPASQTGAEAETTDEQAAAAAVQLVSQSTSGLHGVHRHRWSPNEGSASQGSLLQRDSGPASLSNPRPVAPPCGAGAAVAPNESVTAAAVAAAAAPAAEAVRVPAGGLPPSPAEAHPMPHLAQQQRHRHRQDDEQHRLVALNFQQLRRRQHDHDLPHQQQSQPHGPQQQQQQQQAQLRVQSGEVEAILPTGTSPGGRPPSLLTAEVPGVGLAAATATVGTGTGTVDSRSSRSSNPSSNRLGEVRSSRSSNLSSSRLSGERRSIRLAAIDGPQQGHHHQGAAHSATVVVGCGDGSNTRLGAAPDSVPVLARGHPLVEEGTASGPGMKGGREHGGVAAALNRTSSQPLQSETAAVLSASRCGSGAVSRRSVQAAAAAAASAKAALTAAAVAALVQAPAPASGGDSASQSGGSRRLPLLAAGTRWLLTTGEPGRSGPTRSTSEALQACRSPSVSAADSPSSTPIHSSVISQRLDPGLADTGATLAVAGSGPAVYERVSEITPAGGAEAANVVRSRGSSLNRGRGRVLAGLYGSRGGAAAAVSAAAAAAAGGGVAPGQGAEVQVDGSHQHSRCSESLLAMSSALPSPLLRQQSAASSASLLGSGPGGDVGGGAAATAGGGSSGRGASRHGRVLRQALPAQSSTARSVAGTASAKHVNAAGQAASAPASSTLTTSASLSQERAQAPNSGPADTAAAAPAASRPPHSFARASASPTLTGPSPSAPLPFFRASAGPVLTTTTASAAPSSPSSAAAGSSGITEPQALRLISCTLRASDIPRAPGARTGRVCSPEELSRKLLAESGGAATKVLLTRAAGGTADLPPPSSKSARGVFPPIAEDEAGGAADGAPSGGDGGARRRVADLSAATASCGCVVM